MSTISGQQSRQEEFYLQRCSQAAAWPRAKRTRLSSRTAPITAWRVLKPWPGQRNRPDQVGPAHGGLQPGQSGPLLDLSGAVAANILQEAAVLVELKALIGSEALSSKHSGSGMKKESDTCKEGSELRTDRLDGSQAGSKERTSAGRMEQYSGGLSVAQ